MWRHVAPDVWSAIWSSSFVALCYGNTTVRRNVGATVPGDRHLRIPNVASKNEMENAGANALQKTARCSVRQKPAVRTDSHWSNKKCTDVSRDVGQVASAAWLSHVTDRTVHLIATAAAE